MVSRVLPLEVKGSHRQGRKGRQGNPAKGFDLTSASTPTSGTGTRPGQVLAHADPAWLSRLITRRESPEQFMHALQRQPDDIKVVIEFSQA